MRVAAMSVLVLVTATSSVFAAEKATVTTTNGTVLVDTGAGFKKIADAANVPDGARVMVTVHSQATLAYADGCKLSLQASTITTVSSKVGCKPASQVAGADLTPDQIDAVKSGAPISAAADPAAKGVPVWMLAGGTAAAGGLAGYLIGQANSSTDTVYVPISR